jgi:transaldolase
MTLVFSLTQGMAAADAGAFLIAPSVGRILDWHLKNGSGPFTAESDPGVCSVRRIYATYKASGIPTVVMGASFRNTGEIEALAGCDRLTIAPALMDELAATSEPLRRALSPAQLSDAQPWVHYTEATFRFALQRRCDGDRKARRRYPAFFEGSVRSALACARAHRAGRCHNGGCFAGESRLAEIDLKRQATG